MLWVLLVRVTRAQAGELVARLQGTTPAAAAQQVRVELEAIRPYGCRDLSRIGDILWTLAARSEAGQAAGVAQLEAMAEGGQS